MLLIGRSTIGIVLPRAQALVPRAGSIISGAAWRVRFSSTSLHLLGRIRERWRAQARRKASAIGLDHDRTSCRAETEIPKLLFLRGARQDYQIGTTDWRIAYSFPRLGYRTFLLAVGPGWKRYPDRGVETVVVPFPRLPFFSLLLNVLALPPTLACDPDIVVWNPGFFPAMRCLKLLRPRITSVLDVRTVPVETTGISGSLTRILFQKAVRSSCFDGLTFISEGIRHQVVREYGCRVNVPSAIWASGVDGNVFDPHLSGDPIRQQYGLERDFVVLFHGSLSPNRGLDLAIRAVSGLSPEFRSRVRLVLLGAGTARQHLAELSEKLHVRDRVLFLDPVTHDVVAQYVAAADAGIDPLPAHPWWDHSSPLKVYEYLAMGKPVIASDIPAHRAVSSAVVLYPSQNVHALEQAFETVMSWTDEKRLRCREAALRDSAGQTWHDRAIVLNAFITRLRADGASRSEHVAHPGDHVQR